MNVHYVEPNAHDKRMWKEGVSNIKPKRKDTRYNILTLRILGLLTFGKHKITIISKAGLAQSIEYWTCDLGECNEPGSSPNLRKY